MEWRLLQEKANKDVIVLVDDQVGSFILLSTSEVHLASVELRHKLD